MSDLLMSGPTIILFVVAITLSVYAIAQIVMRLGGGK